MICSNGHQAHWNNRCCNYRNNVRLLGHQDDVTCNHLFELYIMILQNTNKYIYTYIIRKSDVNAFNLSLMFCFYYCIMCFGAF